MCMGLRDDMATTAAASLTDCRMEWGAKVDGWSVYKTMWSVISSSIITMVILYDVLRRVEHGILSHGHDTQQESIGNIEFCMVLVTDSS